MHAWEAIQKTLDYIEQNISENLPIEELADVAALSPFYYQRLFSRLVKKPVREYIKLRRLSRVLAELQNRDRRILDIAVDYGFGSHGSFTRAFKAAYELTPEEYRNAPIFLNQFDKPDLLLSYTMVDEGVPLISEGIVMEFNRKELDQPIMFMGVTGVVPIEGQMPAGESTGVDIPGEVWRQFHREKHLIPRIDNGREVGVAYLGDAPEGSFTYFAGAEVDNIIQDDRFKQWQLPDGDYVICGFEAEDFEQLTTVALNKAIKYCRFWLEKHHLVMKLYSPEIYYDSTPQGVYMELWMPIEK